jgi:hypothetical protein
MIEIINRTEEIRNRLKSEGKVKTLNSIEHIEAIFKMNEAMEELKREYILRVRQSQISASQTIINA